MEIVINNETYICKKADINLSKFDEDGISGEYENNSYVIFEPNEEPRVRIFDGIFDENNRRNSFDPLNYSKYIHVRLRHGDECYIEDLYEILSTTNIDGKIVYDYLDEEFLIHDDLIADNIKRI